MHDPQPADTIQQIESILAAQRAAFLRHGAPGLSQRRDDLKKLRTAILSRRREIEQAIDADFGYRSFHETSMIELLSVAENIGYMRRNLRRFMRPQRRFPSFTFGPGAARILYQPLGVVGVMAPWNYPVVLAVAPLVTALAAGNRVMLKPSEITPRTSECLKRLLAATFPEEQVAVVLGDATVGAAFSALPFDHLVFTGSTRVGSAVMRAASENLVPVTLELGGKSPVIIEKGHVNDRTMGRIVFGKLSNAGQTCVAPDYALVHEDDAEAFVAAFGPMVAKLYPQGPTSPDFSSIINERSYERLKGLIEDARAKGARVLEVGNRPETAANRAHTLAPTLLVGATDDMLAMREEIFGPILPVRAYRSLDEVIDFVNARPRPLALYYFGEEGEACRKVLSRTTSGNVGINNTVLHVGQDALPFGGVGPSGMGNYHGIEGFRRLSHGKGVFAQGRLSIPDILRAPYGRLADRVLAFMLRP
jgi:coniferyl-aldehyde dehydrogenase